MRVFFDGRAFESALSRGIQRVFVETASRMSGVSTLTIGLRAAAAGPVPSGCSVFFAPLPTAKRWNLVRRTVRLLQKRRWASVIDRHDLFHTTYFTLPPSDFLPVVVTVYDMIPEHFPDYFQDAERHIQNKRDAIAAASVCVCISESTASELRAFYPDAAPKIRVIYPGCEHFSSPAEAAPQQRQGFVLYVGERGRYKNFRTLLHALLEPNWPKGLILHVVGRPFTAAESLLISRLGLADRVRHLGRLTDRELATAYACAKCFVYPSLMEGFGFPVLEAQAMGCSVACSDTAVFREVAGPSAFYFDPRSPRAVAEGVSEAAEAQVGSDDRDVTRDHLRRFSWDRAAEQTLDVYREVLTRRATAST